MSPTDLVLLLALAASLLALHVLRRRAIRAQRDMLTLVETTTQLRHLADHDALTGLLNRRRFEHELDRHLEHIGRYGPEGAALVLDLDCFKPVNDTWGHAAGDRLLARVGQVLRDRLRATDVVARLGGDEFAILLPRVDREGAAAVAQSLVETIRDQVLAADASAVTVSVGVMQFDDCPTRGAQGVLAAADLAMYEAKATGGDCHAFFAGDLLTARRSAHSASASSSSSAVLTGASGPSLATAVM